MEQKCLTYIGNVTVNGFPGIEKRKRPVFDKPRIPKVPANLESKSGTKQILDEQGADGLVQWIKDQKEVLLTDTTFRDAHQSLLQQELEQMILNKLQNQQQNYYLIYFLWKCGAEQHLMLPIVS